jgi:A/G-specific adenine glycosylase
VTDFTPLLEWYRRSHRDLPWRRQVDPYRVLVSEFMLQQTRVEVVIPYYERFLERFPDVGALAAATSEQVLPLWSGLGYYSRARNLHRAAVAITEQGEFPGSESALRELPGVGAYTAAAVASIALGLPAVALDGNAIRVLARVFGYRGRSGPELQRLVWPWLPTQAPAEFTQAVMELGATICKPREPLCLLCPLQSQCRARQEGSTDQIPPRRAGRIPIALTLQAVRCHGPQGWLLERRHRGRLLKGIWMFPYRSLEEGGLASLPWEMTEPVWLGKVTHSITHHQITVEVFESTAQGPVLSEDLRWATPVELAELVTSSLTLKIQTLTRGGPSAARTPRGAMFCHK